MREIGMREIGMREIGMREIGMREIAAFATLDAGDHPRVWGPETAGTAAD